MADVKGDLHISNEVIADIVCNAALECYGVVGLSEPGAAPASAAAQPKILSMGKSRRGVVIAPTDNGIAISVYVVLEYGLNISVVTQNLRDRIQFLLSTFVQAPVESIEIYVAGIKVRR